VRVRIDGATATDAATERDRAMVRLTVEDSGPGIAEDVRAKLFEPFFTTRAAEGGTGLGLAVVRSIVVEHGGTVTASSTAGVGARFEVMLPRSESNRA
jgi:signal transduction histidine kinase